MDSASLIFAIIVLLIGLGISYFVIKCAVCNGINESLLFANKERWEKVRNDFPDLKLPAYENRHNDNPTYEPVQK